MKRLACGALLCVLPSLFPAAALSQSLSSGHIGTRHKSSAITLRGVVSNLHSGTFTLRTKTRGRVSVSTKSATSVVEKGVAGRVSIHSGDHVSVRGFLRGGKMVAIRIRIFPIKPKAFSVRGTVASVSLNQITIVSSGKVIRAQLAGTTQVRRGSRVGTTGQIKPGDRVEARLQLRNHVLFVLRIHIYATRVASGKHVRLHGIVFHAFRSSLSIRSGHRTVSVAFTKGTKIYLGNSKATLASVKIGQTVTVYACCAGHHLSATSIHIRKSALNHKSILIRGRVIAISRTEISIKTLTGSSSVRIARTTVFEFGSSRIPAGKVQIGDELSIRAIRVGGRFDALRVHIFASSRRIRSFTGTVISQNPGTLTILSRGKRYRLSLSSKTTITLNGKPSLTSTLRGGDRIRVRAQPGPNGLLALQVVAKRSLKKPKLVTVRGTLGMLRGTRLIVVDSFGVKHEVRIPIGVHIRLRGKNATADAVFVGAAISARGLLVKGVLVARTLTLSVRSRKVDGRVLTVARSTVVLLLRNRLEVTVHLLKGAKVTDAGKVKSWVAIRKDAYLAATGYVQPSLALRTSKAEILHPALDMTATVIATAPVFLVETSTKDQYRLTFLPATQISTGAAQVLMGQTDISTGTRLRFSGKVDSDGSVSLTAIVLRLKKVTVRGQITSIQAPDLHIQSSTGLMEIKTQPRTAVAQGSRSLQLSDLVAHDDVTVYGYSGRPGIIFARKLSVHRRLLGFSGTVESTTSNSFELSAPDGPHRILLGPAVSFSSGSAGDIAPGKSLHVTGYLRGDGSVLATRITFKKSKQPLTLAPWAAKLGRHLEPWQS